MAKQNRRDFFKTTALLGAGITGLTSKTTKASSKNILSEDRMGVLVDTTVCIGCRNCEWACKNAHNLPAGNIEDYADRSVFEKTRRPNDKALTIVNEYPNPNNSALPYDVKVQCMHCDHPACVSACIVGAFSKEENGTVLWNTDKCIGCRYCMVACPFQIPAFEYDKPFWADIKKCDFCFELTKVGKLPACVDICPVEAITYGRRDELVKTAHQRIKQNPERYIDHIYGEYEAGGTSWLYLSAKKFEDIGLPKLGNEPAPGVSEAIQHGVFSYFLPPIALYAILGGVMWINKNRKNTEKEAEK